MNWIKQQSQFKLFFSNESSPIQKVVWVGADSLLDISVQM